MKMKLPIIQIKTAGFISYNFLLIFKIDMYTYFITIYIVIYIYIYINI